MYHGLALDRKIQKKKTKHNVYNNNKSTLTTN